jgi:hypothetical protein
MDVLAVPPRLGLVDLTFACPNAVEVASASIRAASTTLTEALIRIVVAFPV